MGEPAAVRKSLTWISEMSIPAGAAEEHLKRKWLQLTVEL